MCDFIRKCRNGNEKLAFLNYLESFSFTEKQQSITNLYFFKLEIKENNYLRVLDFFSLKIILILTNMGPISTWNNRKVPLL